MSTKTAVPTTSWTGLPVTADEFVSDQTCGVLGMDEDGHLTGDPAVLAWARGVAERGTL